MREIVTLQLGNLSNHVATHFWNTQESYFTYGDQGPSTVSHDVHWRAGIAPDGSETYLPRTVIYDLKTAFGSLRTINALYEPGDEATPHAALWNRQPVEQRLPSISPSRYVQALDAGEALPTGLTSSTVRYWSDYSRVLFHPRSLVPLYDSDAGLSSGPRGTWLAGRDMFQDLCRDEDIVDRDWRPFVEEADSLQGINIITGADDVWGGFAAAYAERLRDEFGKTCIWAWPLQTSAALSPASGGIARSVSLARTICALSETVTMSTPMAPPPTPHAAMPSLEYSSMWHVSALFATAIETVSLPSRIGSERSLCASHLDRLSSILNARGNQSLAKVRLRVGLPHAEGSREFVAFPLAGPLRQRNWAGDGQTIGNSIFGRFSVDRGSQYSGQPQSPVLEDGISPPTLSQMSHQYPLDFPILDSFPAIFRCTGMDNAPRKTVSVSAESRTDSGISSDLRDLRSMSTKFFSLDERETLSSSLAEVADAYMDGWTSGSDEGDDF